MVTALVGLAALIAAAIAGVAVVLAVRRRHRRPLDRYQAARLAARRGRRTADRTARNPADPTGTTVADHGYGGAGYDR
ncbi:hypothetical protein GCM10009635_31760 [Actinocatenispora thailandica]